VYQALYYGPSNLISETAICCLQTSTFHNSSVKLEEPYFYTVGLYAILISFTQHVLLFLKLVVSDEAVGFYNLPNSFSRTMALPSLNGLSMKCGRASTPHKSMGLHDLLQG
jgi:hypothetical protein